MAAGRGETVRLLKVFFLTLFQIVCLSKMAAGRGKTVRLLQVFLKDYSDFCLPKMAASRGETVRLLKVFFTLFQIMSFQNGSRKRWDGQVAKSFWNIISDFFPSKNGCKKGSGKRWKGGYLDSILQLAFWQNRTSLVKSSWIPSQEE